MPGRVEMCALGSNIKLQHIYYSTCEVEVPCVMLNINYKLCIRHYTYIRFRR